MRHLDRRIPLILFPTALVLAVWAAPERSTATSRRGTEPAFTADFPLLDCKFTTKNSVTSRKDNRYFALEPGYQLCLAGEDEGRIITLFITVLEDKETIEFDYAGEQVKVKVRVVEERELADGELTEILRNFFARCRNSNDVYYFGEDVDIYEDGEIVSHDGAWRAGVNGALPGIIIPGTFLLGSRYFQELAPGVALDRALHAEVGLTVETPAGTFGHCVLVLEDSALDPAANSEKVYCPGIGLVRDDELTLVSFGSIDDDDDDDHEGNDDADNNDDDEDEDDDDD